MTNPAATRWKVRSSKKPRVTRASKDADVRGESLTSSVKANVPQLVATVTVYVLAGSRRAVGAVRWPDARGDGVGTVVQPDAVVRVAGADVRLVEDDEDALDPQPETATRITRGRSRRRTSS